MMMMISYFSSRQNNCSDDAARIEDGKPRYMLPVNDFCYFCLQKYVSVSSFIISSDMFALCLLIPGRTPLRVNYTLHAYVIVRQLFFSRCCAYTRRFFRLSARASGTVGAGARPAHGWRS